MDTSNFDLKKLLRKNVKNLIPYSSARDEFTGKASVFLDANENPFENGVNRYPDPLQRQLKKRIGEIKSVDSDRLILGNGSDEVIDLLFRAFCEPNTDNVVICTPTYGMYEVAANINAVEIRKAALNSDFQPEVQLVLNTTDQNTKLLFLCSPNNPTANLYEEVRVFELLNKFSGIVVVDEAYIDFAKDKTYTKYLNQFPNLVILQTLSKAWGMAGIRLGIGMASNEIVQFLNRIKPPYNVNSLTQKKALEALKKEKIYEKQIELILKERTSLFGFLSKCEFVEKVYSSDANFLLIKVKDASGLYDYLLRQGIVIRDRSKIESLEQCVRISVGTKEENRLLKKALLSFDTKFRENDNKKESSIY
ncbi:histidinol-phosphate transaminase [Ancylomarina longa]|uniref:Histidinol-phosphate aminotransferase n=1 Tax=Ancylomarina longa TaxID=2487017 RepID=A0A434B067_9BACT|nr:histidinol-phosphate transaminase [Ancylomarina longa]RUT80107.1 histidinol-phosphate transaminase [Ancylomarina longa]